jgi:hypothetical protein
LRKKNDASKLIQFKIDKDSDHTLDDVQARRAVLALKKIGLVEATKGFYQVKGEVVALRFSGLFWYFIYSGLEDGINCRIQEFFRKWGNNSYLINGKYKYSKMASSQGSLEPMPICHYWSKMINAIDENKCLEKLIETFHYYHVSGKILVTIKSFGLELQTYITHIEDSSPRGDFEKDSNVLKFLKTKEANLLKEAYFAYLINEDILLLSDKSGKEIESLIPKLKSYIEITDLDGKLLPKQLFSKDGFSSLLYKIQ